MLILEKVNDHVVGQVISSAGLIDIGNSNRDQASLYILYGKCSYVNLLIVN
jgi:hypothetical protein